MHSECTQKISFFFFFEHQCQYMCVLYAGITGTLMTRKFKYSKREPPSFALLVKNKANKLCNNEINTLQPNIGLDIQNWTFKMLKKKKASPPPVLNVNTSWGTWTIQANKLLYRLLKKQKPISIYKYKKKVSMALQKWSLIFQVTMWGHIKGCILGVTYSLAVLYWVFL